MILVKLGGSIITNKNKMRSFRRRNCMRLCRELRAAGEQLVIVHGAGSFGHILAARAKLQMGIEENDSHKLREVARVHRDVRDLNQRVLDCMNESGLRGFSIPPDSVASFSSGEIAEFRGDRFDRLLEKKMIPVSFGDIVPDQLMMFSICSGDLVMLALAEHFHPEKVLFVADVDGIFDADPKISKKARLIESLSQENAKEISSERKGEDVTGSMSGKIARMLEIAGYCENCIILNGNAAGRLERALRGQNIVSTRVVH